jgi:hypothetical protein
VPTLIGERRSHFPIWPRVLKLLHLDSTSPIHRPPVAVQSVDWASFYDRLLTDHTAWIVR